MDNEGRTVATAAQERLDCEQALVAAAMHRMQAQLQYFRTVIRVQERELTRLRLESPTWPFANRSIAGSASPQLLRARHSVLHQLQRSSATSVSPLRTPTSGLSTRVNSGGRQQHQFPSPTLPSSSPPSLPVFVWPELANPEDCVPTEWNNPPWVQDEVHRIEALAAGVADPAVLDHDTISTPIQLLMRIADALPPFPFIQPIESRPRRPSATDSIAEQMNYYLLPENMSQRPEGLARDHDNIYDDLVANKTLQLFSPARYSDHRIVPVKCTFQEYRFHWHPLRNKSWYRSELQEHGVEPFEPTWDCDNPVWSWLNGMFPLDKVKEGDDLAFVEFLSRIGVSADMADSWASYWGRLHKLATEPLPDLVPVYDGLPVTEPAGYSLAPTDAAHELNAVDDGTVSADHDDVLMMNDDDPDADTLAR